MNGKNPVEPEKNDKFPKKTYTFDVIKCDEIFDLRVKDGQMIVPPGAKLPSLEQRKKRGFFKYHSFLGHKTCQCFLFRDLVQNAIQEGRLKFGDKTQSQMKIDSDPLQIVEAHYTKPEEVNFIEVGDDFCMTEVTEEFVHRPVMVRVHEHFEQAPLEGSDRKWVKQAKGRKHGHGKWQNFEVERGSSLVYRQEFSRFCGP